MDRQKFKPHSLAVIMLGAFAACGSVNAQADDDLANQLRQLREELRQVREELQQVKRDQQQPVTATAPPAASTPSWARETGMVAGTAAPVASATSGSAALPPTPSLNAGGTGLRFFGYGEMSYSRPRRKAADAEATAGRAVLGFAYGFNERTRMAAEIEIENAVVSASDKGEVALEQMYIEHDLSPSMSAKAGLFLLPVGYLNEVHEPTRYFGVRRNFIETAIIPTTWREMGVAVRGTTQTGLRWDAGIVTGFDLTKWDAASTEGQESPLAAIHQEGQKAKARSLAGVVALNYNGLPGWNFGGSLYYGGAGHKQPNFAAPDATVSLAEVHARWQPGRWDLSALAAQGRFGNVDALNATFAGQTTPVPAKFGGWYTQAAYKAWQAGDQSFWPFARYERFNTAQGFSGLAAGLAPDPQGYTRVVTVGGNYYLHPQVVVKADYQRFLSDSMRDRLNLGVGFHF